MIYSIAYDSVATKSTHTNEWVNIDIDLYPYAIIALNEAWNRSYLSASQDLADYKLGGMNIGWELPGMNIADMKIRNLSLIVSEATSLKDNNFRVTPEFELYQNYPNPFNPTTIIKYSLPVVATHESPLQNLTLKVYDILGKEITTLINETKQPGIYEVSFNAVIYPSGVYYYQLRYGKYLQTKKMILVK